MNWARETPINIRRIVWLLLPGVFLAAFSFAGAQTPGGRETQAAMEDLAERTGVAIQTEEDARKVCNQEQYLSACIDVGKKYNLYDAERKKQVDEFLEEAKEEVVGELRSCKSEECLLGVAKKLAEKITKNKPDLASRLELTPEKVEEKEEVKKTARESGDPSFALAEALRAGKYQCGDNTPEGCGNFCLDPGAEARARGTAGIPAVCRQIAQEFYGPEGVRSLESAYREVEEVQKYFEEKRINRSFVTHDGKKLYDPKEIGRYLESEGRRGNTEAVAKGMDYLIQYGFATPADKEFALRFVENIREQGKVVNFDECAKSPEACAEFVPADVHRTFTRTEEARRLMDEAVRQHGVPDPLYCGSEEYAERCLEASKSILPKIEEMASEYPEVVKVAADLRKHVENGEKQIQARVRAREEITRSGKIQIGDREFASFADLTEFCRTNGSLCLADAAKQGLVEKDVATEKYKTAFEIQYRAPSIVPRIIQATTTTGRAAVQALTTEKKEELLNEFKRWLEDPVGPPPVPYGEVPRPAPPYPFQERQTGTSYYISPEMERCLAEKGVRGEAIDAIRRGGSSDRSAERAGADCAKDIAAGKYRDKENQEVNILPEGVEPCLRSKGVREEDIRRMKRGERVELYLEEVKKGCYGEAPTLPDPPRPAEEDKESLLKNIAKPFEPILKPIVGDLLEREKSLEVRYPYTFSDGFIAKTRSEAEVHCKEYPPGSGRGISAECEAKIGVPYYEGQKREYVNWVKYTWTFADKSTESSYIFDRKDAEYINYLKDVERQCVKIQKYKFKWKEKAGESNPENWKNFGIPDCSGEKVAEDSCFAKYGPGWITKDTTKNCYDAYGPNFKTSDGKVYSCGAVPVGISAPGCMKQTTEEAPKPIYGKSPSDCSPAQYWDENAKTCAIYTCPSGYAWSEGIRGCKNTKDGSPICPSSTYWNTVKGACETLKCAPPLFWSAELGQCIDGATDPLIVDPGKPYGDCALNISQSSCGAQPGCQWYTENGKNFCQGNDYYKKACGDGVCGSGESQYSCSKDCGINKTSYPNCGNGTCSAGEDYWNCHLDCKDTGYTGGNYSCNYNGQCEGNLGEAPGSCPSDCTGYSGGSSNWKNKTWTFLNGTEFSSILNRTDKEYLDYVAGIETKCKTIKKENFCWLPGAGNQSDWKNFGIPDCSGTCASGGSGGGGGYGGSSSCSASLKTLLGDGCHYMYNNSSGQQVYCDGPMTKSAKEGDAATTSGCSSYSGGGYQYPGDQNSCPGFAYSVWDSNNKRYCKLNSKESCQYNYPEYLKEENYSSANCPGTTTGGGGSTSCSASLKTLLGADCHWMYFDSSGKSIYCDGPMSKSAKEGDTATTAGCSSGTSGTSGTTGGTGTGGSTTACNSNGTCEYGESSGSCPSDCGGTYSGDTCVYTDKATCESKSACRWKYPSGSTTGGWCEPNWTSSGSSGGYYSGGGSGSYSKCFYPNATINGNPPGYTVWCEKDYYNCRQGDPSGATVPLTGLTLGAPSSCESGFTSGSGGGSYGSGSGCGSYTTQSGCTSVSGCAWSNNACYWAGTGGGSGTYSGGSSSCSSALTALLGSGCHYMYQNSSGQSIYCNGEMTQSAKEGDTAATAGCSSSGGGAYNTEKNKGFATVLDAVKKVFWALSY